jgi:hypothetical protein
MDGRPPILPLKSHRKAPLPLAITALIGLQNRGWGFLLLPAAFCPFDSSREFSVIVNRLLAVDTSWQFH